MVPPSPRGINADQVRGIPTWEKTFIPRVGAIAPPMPLTAPDHVTLVGRLPSDANAKSSLPRTSTQLNETLRLVRCRLPDG